jgi:hypothetical protein
MNVRSWIAFRNAAAAGIAATLLASSVLVVHAAAPTREQKCEAKKNKVAGEYAECLAKAQKKLTMDGDAAEYAEKIARCSAVYSRDWQKSEEIAGAGNCASEGDETEVQNFIGGCQTCIADELTGSALCLDPATCMGDLSDCRSALEATGACDVQALAPGIVNPTCPNLTRDQQCDPVDTQTCVYRSGSYICDAPACSCGANTTTAGCMLAPPSCDPVCEPPTCGTNCETDQCGDEGCPVCEVACGTPRCSAICHNPVGATWPPFHDCASTFGCSLPITECTVTCQPPLCYWIDLETSGTPPACEATLPLANVGTAFADKLGRDCSAPAGTQDRDWQIICERPECEISCPDIPDATCAATADCEADCQNPDCTVTCDTPACSIDPDTNANICSPPTNCTTTCQCRIGVCTRSS